MNFLTGYKTYISMAAGVITAISLYASGSEPLGPMIEQIITAVGLIFLRSGVANLKS